MKDLTPKQQRLAAALRENLKRRKSQARSRAAGERAVGERTAGERPVDAGGAPQSETAGKGASAAGDTNEPGAGASGTVATEYAASEDAASEDAAAADIASNDPANDLDDTGRDDPGPDVTWRVRLVAAELEAERIAALIERAVEDDGFPVTRYEFPDGLAGSPPRGADAEGAKGARAAAPRSSTSVAVEAGAGAPAWSARLSGEEELPWAVEVLVFGGTAAAARARVAEAVGGDGFGAAITVEPVADENWVAKSLEGLAPVREGRFLVRGGHHRGAESGIVLEIDAGLAFGTGHHATTVGCLAALERLLKRRRPGRALDLGTGTGVLAIALARLAHVDVVATDIDPIAVSVARANAAANGVAPRVRPFVADGMHDVRLARGGFDLVVANILARPLERLAPAIGRALAPRAAVVLSGLRVADGRRIEAAYRRQGLRIVHRDARDGWLTLTFERRG